MPAASRATPKAQRTRSAILDAAEALFAERGFEATRLEDVAARVQIRRASIVYHFESKREIYEAVLARVFGGLYERISAVLEAPGPLPPRIEAAVSAWVDFVGERPSLARLLLHEVAQARPGRAPAVLRQIGPFVGLVERIRASSEEDSLLRHSSVDPAHFSSVIAGTTVFFLAAMPVLSPGFQVGPDAIETHRLQLLRITRRLLTTATSVPDTDPGDAA